MKAFVVGDTVFFNQRDKVPLGITTQRRNAKWGFAERKFSGSTDKLVKLQRPPPDIKIFLPILLLLSSTSTFRPRCPAVNAHIRPEAPPPTIITSNTEAFATTLLNAGKQVGALYADTALTR